MSTKHLHRSLFTVLLAVIILMAPSSAISVEPLRMKLGDMVSQSDYILIARVKRVYAGEGPLMLADIEPISLVKGPAPTTVVFKTGIHEHDPDCCEPGVSYLFFLENTPKGSIVTVGGRDAAIKVTSQGPT